jgi:hypothetical protein
MDVAAAREVITLATGRATLDAGLDWIARDARLEDGTDLHTLLRAVACLPDDPGAQAALRRLTRKIAASDFDTAAFLFDAATIDRPRDLEDALLRVASHSPGGRLAKASESALIAAQRSNPRAVEALCYAAGLSYGELQTRVSGLPSEPDRSWTPSQVRAAFKELDMIIRGEEKVDLPDASPVRPLELLISGRAGDEAWDALETQLQHGVPYGVLLAQRAAGGTWLAHRNRTTSKVPRGLAAKLCEALDERGIKYWRSTSVGGDKSVSTMREVTRSDKQIALVVVEGERPVYGVIFSVMRDSGSASKAARKLIGMARDRSLPTAVLVAGPGWAARSETAELAAAFDGRLFSDRDLPRLADDIVQAGRIRTTTQGAVSP